MFELLQMWAIMEVLGIVFLPLTVTVFHNLPDRGWAFSKVVGLSALVFSVWLPLMSIPILPFSRLFILGVLVLLTALNLAGFLRVRHILLDLLRSQYIYIICVECIFFGMVFLLGWLRSYGPDISSFEMYMDEGFLSAIMRSPHLPPNDMWYAGQPINYYYYAHYTIALLAKLLGQSPSIAFNTGIAMFFGLTAVNLFGVTSNIVAWAQHRRRRSQRQKRSAARTVSGQDYTSQTGGLFPPLRGAIPFGLLTILLAQILGNLAATQTWWQNHGDLPDFYWFNASRVISNTINEFPAFSFLLSCFHAHVLALAFTIVGIALAFNLLLEPTGQGLQAFGRGWQLPLTLLTSALMIGSLYAMNGWDYPTYLLLALVCLGFQQWHAHGGRLSWYFALDLFTVSVALGALSFFLFTPFYLHFVSPAQGLGLVTAANRTPLIDELLIYGLFAFIFFSFLLASFFHPCAFDRPIAVTSSTVPAPIPLTPVTLSHHSATGQIQPIPTSSLTQAQVKLGPIDHVVGEVSHETASLVIDQHEASENIQENDRPIPASSAAPALFLADQEHKQHDEEQEQDPLSLAGLNWRNMRVVGLLATLLIGLTLSLVLKNSLTFVTIGGLAALGAVLILYHIKERERSFVLLLGSTACALVAFCEIVFLRDVFADQVPRMNTVFKFYFQAWALLSVVGGAGAYFVLDSLRPARRIISSVHWPLTASRMLWTAALLIFLLLGAVYPLKAVPQRYSGLTRDTSLDGLDYLDRTDPADYAAIRWINAHIAGDPVIVEAPGGEYTMYGLVSVFTGLPSPMNWQGHEWQWRVNWVSRDLNSADFFQRIPDINQIYTNKSPQEVLTLMARYHAQYLYVGPLEQQTYLSSGADLQRFGAFMQIVYQEQGVTIYQVS